MKSFIVLTVLASVLIASSAATKCENTIVNSIADDQAVKDGDLSALVSLQFKSSYKYLLMSMNFNSFLKDRPGLNKLFREHSDKLFDNSIALAKHLTTRGYNYNPNIPTETGDTSSSSEATKIALSEQAALKKGVNEYKVLITGAENICKSADAEMKHYIQEELLEGYVKSLRQFTGYYNNLNNFGANDYKLGVFLFDEYLQKQ